MACCAKRSESEIHAATKVQGQGAPSPSIQQLVWPPVGFPSPLAGLGTKHHHVRNMKHLQHTYARMDAVTTNTRRCRLHLASPAQDFEPFRASSFVMILGPKRMRTAPTHSKTIFGEYLASAAPVEAAAAMFWCWSEEKN